MMEKLNNFFRDAKSEFRHVNWPTRQEGMRLTGVVIALSVGIAIFLGLFDFIFTSAIKQFILK